VQAPSITYENGGDLTVNTFVNNAGSTKGRWFDNQQCAYVWELRIVELKVLGRFNRSPITSEDKMWGLTALPSYVSKTASISDRPFGVTPRYGSKRNVLTRQLRLNGKFFPNLKFQLNQHERILHMLKLNKKPP